MSKLIIAAALAALFASAACADSHPVDPLNCSLFERAQASLALREAFLACGKEPAWTDKAAWYTYGDCSGYYGPIDAAE